MKSILKKYIFKFVIIIFIINIHLLIISCSKEPKQIEFGKDVCAHCEMTIADTKWGAELMTEKGKVYKFDSIECLAAFYLDEILKKGIKTQYLLTIDYSHPGEFIDATKAIYLISPEFHSPMKLDAGSFKNMEELNIFKKNNNYEILNWDLILNKVKKNWM